MADAIEMDSDLDDDLKYYGEVCEMFDGLSDDSFTGFSSDGNDNDVLEEELDEETLDPLQLPTKKVWRNKDVIVVPEGWSNDEWKSGGIHFSKSYHVFTAVPGLNFDVPNNAVELFSFINFCLANF